MIGFSLSAASAGIIWVIVTQIDKLLLSAILPLSEYGIFSIVTLAANGILLVSAPISGSLAPRLMALRGQGDDTSYLTTYRRATQFTAATVLPVAITLAFFSGETLKAWTGDARIVEGGAQALALYAAGTGLLTLSAFPAYLQYASGELKWHVLGEILFLLAIVPLIAWLATRFGAVGAGAAWLTVNITYFLAWVPVVHRRFLPASHWTWLTRDVAAIVLPAVVMALLLRLTLPFPDSRLLTAVELGMAGVAVLMAAAAGSDWIRSRLMDLLANGRR
jgi:O-antigen/teichoic acid export membrane protein